MEMQHVSFWADFAGRIGAPVFAATLVTLLLESRCGPSTTFCSPQDSY